MKFRAAKSSGARNDAKNCQSRRSSKGQGHSVSKLHTPEARDDEQHHSDANSAERQGRGRTSTSHTRDQRGSKSLERGDERRELTSMPISELIRIRKGSSRLSNHFWRSDGTNGANKGSGNE